MSSKLTYSPMTLKNTRDIQLNNLEDIHDFPRTRYTMERHIT